MSLHTLIEQTLLKQTFVIFVSSQQYSDTASELIRSLKSEGKTVYPVSQQLSEIDGEACYELLDNVSEAIDCLVIFASPSDAERTIQSASHLNLPVVWLEPGSEDQAAINTARAWGMKIVCGYSLLEVMQNGVPV